jgi:hypothetical protein
MAARPVVGTKAVESIDRWDGWLAERVGRRPTRLQERLSAPWTSSWSSPWQTGLGDRVGPRRGRSVRGRRNRRAEDRGGPEDGISDQRQGGPVALTVRSVGFVGIVGARLETFPSLGRKSITAFPTNPTKPPASGPREGLPTPAGSSVGNVGIAVTRLRVSNPVSRGFVGHVGIVGDLPGAQTPRAS